MASRRRTAAFRPRLVGGFEPEGPRVTMPADERLSRSAPWRGERGKEERRCARATVQVLVRAADREVDVAGVERERDGTDAVGEVPNREGAGVVRRLGHLCHRVQARRAVVDVRELCKRDRTVSSADDALGVVGDAHLELTAKFGCTADHVEIGREVVAVRDDRPAVGTQTKGRDGNLERIDRGRVADEDLVGTRPDERRETRAERHRLVPPIRLHPAADQPVAPLELEGVAYAGGRPARQRPQRVAVEIDDTGGQVELVSEVAERIRRVPGGAVGAGHAQHVFSRSFRPARARRPAGVASGRGPRRTTSLGSALAEVGGPDARVLQQRRGPIGHDDRSVLEDIRRVRELESLGGVLFDEEDRRSLVTDLADDLEDRLDEHRRETHRGLVEEQQTRAAHQRSGDREHLLLTPRERAAVLSPALGEHREEGEGHGSRFSEKFPRWR